MIYLVDYFLSIFKIIQVEKAHVHRFNFKRLSFTMTACAQNTVKAKQIDTSCCSWETEKSFPIFAGNIYCLGYRHTLSFTLQLTTINKENENPYILFFWGVSDLCCLAVPWYLHVFSPFGFSNLSKDWPFKKFETNVTANLN